MKDCNLKLIHIRKKDHFGRILERGGLTVAYQFPKGAKIVKVSTAIVSDKDNYCKKVGGDLAISRFNVGNYIMLPVPREQRGSIVGYLRAVFF